jgi:hypothetical protein
MYIYSKRYRAIEATKFHLSSAVDSVKFRLSNAVDAVRYTNDETWLAVALVSTWIFCAVFATWSY